MQFVKNLASVGKLDVNTAGGKGASLGEMAQAGIPVPDGFVILCNAFEGFIKENNLGIEIEGILQKVKHDDIDTVENASKQIKRLILNAQIPKNIVEEVDKNFERLGAKYVAVRSSASLEDSSSDAWAGQLDSFLNTTKETLIENIKLCWASLFTPRAIFYRFEKGLQNKKVLVGVVVQNMVESEVSGIAFSVHPITQDKNQLIIEAGFGLGEAIVSGQITPDKYVVEKELKRIIDKKRVYQEKGLYKAEKGGNEWREISKSEEQKLSDKEIWELSELILKIEKHYGFPCDIEWAKEKGKFYIVQSRPITTLTQTERVPKEESIQTDIDVPILNVEHARDFCLPLIEVWCKGESTDPRGWTDKQQPYKPYILFEKTEGTVNCYMDGRGFEWIRNELKNQLKNDQEFVQKLVKKYLEIYGKSKDSLKKEKTFSYEELVAFIQNYWEGWRIYEALYFLAEVVQEDSEDFRLIKEAFELTDNTGDKGDQAMRKSLERCFPELGELSSVLLIEEIFSKNTPPRIELEKRMKKYFYADDRLFIDKTREDIEGIFGIKINNNEVRNSQEFNGDVGFPGKVIGVVHKIMSYSKAKELKEGEILVTAMTTPEFLPALKKASAFITDEGGIVSHAAIVAREMKKPCIVGTRIATRILKDGDLIAIDANKGVIKILKSSL